MPIPSRGEWNGPCYALMIQREKRILKEELLQHKNTLKFLFFYHTHGTYL
jgi:hypothetical protein